VTETEKWKKNNNIMVEESAETATAEVAAVGDTIPPADTGAAEYNSAVLQGRELEWAVNSPQLLAAHAATNGPIVRTRFPPEPNGYLHIGHAKSMNMNFQLAFDKLNVPMQHRRTIFRYDDTNPEAESSEYIHSLQQDLTWLGWQPERTTYSSDNFQKLYDLAMKLIHKGLAYVCDMTKAEMEAQRELAMRRANARNSGKDPDVEFPIPSPDILPGRNRNTDIVRNVELFTKMKMGFFEEGTYTLRLKMDFESSNPNMYDLVAYRIKYTPHPHAGNGWCIYPAYDYTHGICDSLEAIDYSICTLEFETRREPYFWILWALDLYRPKVYEMSRLNLQYTLLSKRRLIKLVDTKTVRGWDDPRMPTVSGLRRRGYTAQIINTFCTDIGATRAANVVEMDKLSSTARLLLSATSRRAMAALEPIRVVITNFAAEHDKQLLENKSMTFDVPNSPTDETMGKHTITLTSVIYLDAADFRLQGENDADFFGLAPNKAVGLKYHGGNLFCDEVVQAADGKVVELKCHLDTYEGRTKPKTFLSWVPANGIPCEIRVYNNLFAVPEPTDLWEDEINPASEIIYENAIVDPSVRELVDYRNVDKWKSNAAMQLERLGYFVVDYETTYDPETNTGKMILNRTVSLKKDVAKKSTNVAEEEKMNARREQTKKDFEAKKKRMKIDAKNLFREGEEFVGKYSQYDAATGLPTHDADGNELTKSAVKKLAKEQQKHVKQQAAWAKTNKDEEENTTVTA
jgi:glutaminyl-tRNA synthetase